MRRSRAVESPSRPRRRGPSPSRSTSPSRSLSLSKRPTSRSSDDDRAARQYESAGPTASALSVAGLVRWPATPRKRMNTAIHPKISANTMISNAVSEKYVVMKSDDRRDQRAEERPRRHEVGARHPAKESRAADQQHHEHHGHAGCRQVVQRHADVDGEDADAREHHAHDDEQRRHRARRGLVRQAPGVDERCACRSRCRRRTS